MVVLGWLERVVSYLVLHNCQCRIQRKTESSSRVAKQLLLVTASQWSCCVFWSTHVTKQRHNSCVVCFGEGRFLCRYNGVRMHRKPKLQIERFLLDIFYYQLQ